MELLVRVLAREEADPNLSACVWFSLLGLSIWMAFATRIDPAILLFAGG